MNAQRMREIAAQLRAVVADYHLHHDTYETHGPPPHPEGAALELRAMAERLEVDAVQEELTNATP